MNTRRAFLQRHTLFLAALGADRAAASEEGTAPVLRAGLITDIHHADKPSTPTRFYRESLDKLDEAVACFNEERPDFVVELGDFIDQADEVETEIAWLEEAEARYARLEAPRHYVLGNHCVTTLTKEEFAAHSGAGKAGHASFEQGGVRFLILDSCYREDGQPYGRQNFHWQDANFPPSELQWLEAELDRAGEPVIVLAHQRLDDDPAHSVRNAAAARALLEKSGKVAAVFQGHSHRNALQEIGGIHYCTLAAVIEGSGPESSGYSLLDILPDGSLRLHGYRRQESRAWPRA